tara:strand:- start:586 stop:900 length:315 start_codon:yes stop_codon:yes gene_type:complete
MKLESKIKDKNTIEIEVYSRDGKEVPKSQRYKIRIDNEKYVVDQEEMSGSQLLALAGKNPIDQFAIFQRLKGGQTEKIEFNDVVSFLTPGVERFMTLPLDQTEG